ncbi:uncharacterized protein K452DRAFT_66946 [Aplosporella prunicola CBS 121167]|uniref:Uncharacterized protein n=1 Tax=Aplosporella prunicola CBS 121167 TaxID=1176127 RepID=A0A6A6BUP5_9PEZI|nr:uncharacterized protein K452DRAFT_66946 [Aplosporella prunicola CBS 121167]KAF2146527.1 hypothetical protein K452DRAFT_66946 [Aplosporella prunicola CBS 121167]
MPFVGGHRRRHEAGWVGVGPHLGLGTVPPCLLYPCWFGCISLCLLLLPTCLPTYPLLHFGSGRLARPWAGWGKGRFACLLTWLGLAWLGLAWACWSMRERLHRLRCWLVASLHCCCCCFFRWGWAFGRGAPVSSADGWGPGNDVMIWMPLRG